MPQGREVSFDRVRNEEKKNKCPDCGSDDIGYDKGERFCKKCGLVLD